MTFNWEGDLIIQNTSINRKRFVLGSKNKPIKTDIREWISFEDNNITKGIIQKLAKVKGLPTGKTPGSFDMRARILWNYVASEIKYIHDSEKQKKSDFWLFPPEIATLCEGDCEDASFLLASLLISSGISPFCVRVVMGDVYDEKNRLLGGHCWPVYKNEMGEWCILESTLDHLPECMPEADILTSGRQPFRYFPKYCFNNHHLWAILPPENEKIKYERDLEKYLSERAEKVKIRDTRFASGGWLSGVTGPGHYEITSEVLKEFGFSENSIPVLGDTSQDPDFYDWDTPMAHAQRSNSSDGSPKESMEKAIDNYIGWIENLHSKMLRTNNTRKGLLYLGYILHGIEDLAAHQGLTNAEHAYLTYKMEGQDPDSNEVSKGRAKGFCRRYIKLLDEKYSQNIAGLKSYDGGGISFIEKSIFLKKSGWDLSLEGYLEYRKLADKYEALKDKLPPIKHWDIDEVFSNLLQRL